MNITIKAKELDQLKDLPEVSKFLSYNDWNPNRSMRVDVAKMAPEILKKIQRVLAKDPKANACPLDVLKQWEKVQSNPNDVKPRTLEQFATILKRYLSDIPGHTLFSQNDNGDWLPYVVTLIGYQPPKRHRFGVEPAYVFMRMVYYEKGKIQTTSQSFYAKSIEKRTCAEIMDASDFMIGTEDLIKAHQLEVEKYKRFKASTGLQVLGTGSGEVVGETQSWYGGKYRSLKTMQLEVDGRKSRMVIDDAEENDNDNDNRREKAQEAQIPLVDGNFWKGAGVEKHDDGDDDAQEVSDITEIQLEVPLHPFVLCFQLEKHTQVWTHVNRLEEYKYDTTLGSKLVLPEFQRDLIEIMVQKDRAEFKDIISGKAGGSIVLCSGFPGTGKTLTAEVFAEAIERPLYVIQSAQLGTTAEALEGELVKVLSRASRWGAILLIDEADVFIHERGDDIEQNAVVGVFLRVLEYYQGVLFMTTNRATIIDDAIISRCTAQVKFEIPDSQGIARIFKILADISNVKIEDAAIKLFVKKYPGLTGRDAKGLLKLANMVAVKEKTAVTFGLLERVLQFKPTHATIKKGE